MKIQNQIKQYKGILTLLTLTLVITQFYFLSLKLPFDVSLSHKSVGFFNLYLYNLTQSFWLWVPLIGFLFAHILIQSLLAILIFYLLKKLSFIFPVAQKQFLMWGTLLWFFCQITILLWNSYLFPYSFFSMALFKIIPQRIDHFVLFLFSSILFLLVIIVVIHSLIKKTLTTISIMGIAVLIISLPYLYSFISPKYHFATLKEPNVIIVITDSLRPDFTNVKKNDTPITVNNMLKNSVYFSNSLTTLGRSTPALVSILTGDYPRHHGARFNLIPEKNTHLEHSLSQLLKARGYQTIFAADGMQFINLYPNFGFDKVIAAKRGIYDFVFSFINDTPLSNLIMNTRLGRLCFPFNYANRNAYFTYQPNTFIDLMHDKLTNSDPKKPLFMVTALTLAHWPYVWAQQPSLKTIGERYTNSVMTLDDQYKKLLLLLNKRGLLQNTILITLSDHGDSMGLPGDRITTEEKYIGPKDRLNLMTQYPYTVSNPKLIGLNTSAGHGTDLLSMTQLQTTLAFHYYGENFKAREIIDRVALIDIAPTVLNLLHIPSQIQEDGVSLKSIFEGKSNAQLARPLFLESEIDIPLIDVTNKDTSHSTVARLIDQYAHLYDINVDNQKLTLREDVIPRLLQEKQLGVIDNDKLLVYFPGKNNTQSVILNNNSSEIKNCYYVITVPSTRQKLICYRAHPTVPYFVLVDLKSAQWQIFFGNETQKNTTFNRLFQKLQSFYDLPTIP